LVGLLVERKEMKKSKQKEPDVDERFYTGSEFFFLNKVRNGLVKRN